MSDLLRETIRERAFALPESSPIVEAAREMARLGGGWLRAVIFFGSRRTRPSDDPWSAYDFFLLTEGYLEFYRSLAANGALRRGPALVAALNAWLPPNQVSLRPIVGGEALRAKCAVIALDALLRETTVGRRDHFCAGRLFQPTSIVYARDSTSAALALDALVSAHRLTFSWVRPFLPVRFDVDTYVRTLFAVSMGGEIRPEPKGRSEALFEAQQGYHREVYAHVLDELEAQGAVARVDAQHFRVGAPADDVERWRTRAFFRWSLVRATARWAKYMVTFDDWLEYILRKARRHSARPIELTRRERRFPLIFIWPRVVRFLRDRGRS
jgi:hypothetical protein